MIAWSYERSAHEVRLLSERVAKLESKFADLRDSDNAQLRNRLGVELHGGIERAQADLRTTCEHLDSAYGNNHQTQIGCLGTSLSSMMQEVLEKVFGIPPSDQRPQPTPSHGTSGQPHATRIETYSNGDVAGVTIEYRGQQYTGSAKRNPVDKPDPAIGLAVAEARAARQLAKALTKHADKMVAAADAERHRRKKAARRKAT